MISQSISSVMLWSVLLFGYLLLTGVNGQFRDSPHNATSLLSGSATLTCSVPDDTPANILWQYINGTTIVSSERLTITYDSSTGVSELVITNLQYYDNGAYQCVVGNTTSDVGYITAIGAPVFRVQLQPVTVPVREVATFNCDVYSNPALTDVTWRRNNIAIVSGGRFTVTNTQLVIQNVREEDDGSYTCEVTNTFGTVHSTARLQIVNPADFTITTQPSGAITRDVIEDDSFTITCTVGGGTPSTLDWYRSGMRLTESDRTGLTHVGHDSVVLTIRQVNETDGGVYTCVANITATTSINTTISINVLTLPRFITQPSNITDNKDDIICNATGNPQPRVSLCCLEGDMETSDTNSLVLNARNFPMGQYSCIARNVVGESVAYFYIDLTDGVPVVVSPNMTDVGFGNDVTISCIVENGNPTPTVQWTYINNTLPSNVYVFDNNLHIHDADFNNDGVYQCTATNSAGSNSSTTVIKVHAPPVIIRAPQHTTAITGTTIILDCCISSTVPVNVTWTTPFGSLVMPNSASNGTTYDGNLNLTDVTNDQSGPYTCTATTIAGTAIAAADVTIGIIPTFTVTPQSANLAAGGDITLMCSATGDPVPQIIWERTNQTGGRMLVPGSDINSLRNGDLPLTSLQQGDTGLYHCVADNQVDRIESSAMIRIEGPPLVQSITPVIIIAGRDYILNCNLLYDYPTPVISWSRSDGSSITIGRMSAFRNGSLLISPVMINDSMTYTCRATNGFGGSSISTPITVHFQPTINLEVTEYTHVIEETAILPCPTSSNPSAEYEWSIGVNRTMITHGTKYQVNPVTGTLTIAPLEIIDSDVYYCTATNYVGDDTAATMLTVEGPQPEAIIVNTSESTSLLVEWTEPSSTVNLRLYQIIFAEERSLNDTIIRNHTDLDSRSTTFSSLNEFTEYKIIVRGVYSVASDSSVLTFGINVTTTATTAEDVPVGAPQNITIDSDVEKVDIRFEPPSEDDRNGIILGYNIYYRPSPPSNFTNASAGVYMDNGTNITVANYSLAVHRPSNSSATTELYTLRGLRDDTSYNFFMEAFNSVGVGPNTTLYSVTTEAAFPTTLVVVISATVGGLIIITLVVLFIIFCCFYCRRRNKKSEAKANERTARNVKKLIIGEPTTDIAPDTVTSGKFSAENMDGEVIPLNPKVIRPEDRAPTPEPGETALPVRKMSFGDDDQAPRPPSSIYSEPADSIQRYESQSRKTTEDEIVDEAFKEITNTDTEPLYASVPESHKQAKRIKKTKSNKKEKKKTSVIEDTTLGGVDTSTKEGQKLHRMLDAASAGMF